MSQYYYDFCYLPSYYSDIWADEALGGSSINIASLSAPTDLSAMNYSGKAGYYTFGSEGGSASSPKIYYSENWH